MQLKLIHARTLAGITFARKIEYIEAGTAEVSISGTALVV